MHDPIYFSAGYLGRGENPDSTHAGHFITNLPAWISGGWIARPDLLLVNPHTLHNCAAATVAQTCDLEFAREKVELYREEWVEAFIDKRLDVAYRAARRMDLFEARVIELLSAEGS